PLDREPERVLRDVVRGYVSAAAAAAEYGVVVAGDEVDQAATERLREEMRRKAPQGHFEFGPEREAFERTWTRDAYEQLTEILSALPVHWRFFVKTKIFELVGQSEEGRQGVRRAFDAVLAEYP